MQTLLVKPMHACKAGIDLEQAPIAQFRLQVAVRTAALGLIPQRMPAEQAELSERLQVNHAPGHGEANEEERLEGCSTSGSASNSRAD